MGPAQFQLYQLECADEVDAAIEADAIASGRHDLAAVVRRDRETRRARMEGVREYRNGPAGRWAAATRQHPDSGQALALRRRQLQLLKLAAG